MILIVYELPARPSDPQFGGALSLTSELTDDGEKIGFPLSAALNGYYKADLSDYFSFSSSLDLGWRETSIIDGEVEQVGGPLFIYIVNLGELFFGYKNDGLNLKLGRFAYSDPTAKIYTHSSDGFFAGYDLPDFGFDFFIAYTGLHWKNKSTVILSALDEYLRAQQSTFLAPPRLVSSITARTVAEGNNLYLSVFGQLDLNFPEDEKLLINEGDSREDEGIGGHVNNIYLSAGSSGILFDFITYSVFGILEFGTMLYSPREGESKGVYIRGDIFGYCAGVNLRFNLPEELSSLIQFEAAYSSGDKDKAAIYEGNQAGSDYFFLPVSTQTAATVYPFQLGNSWYVDAGWIWFPLKGVGWYELQSSLIVLKARSLFRTSVGPVPVYGVDSTSLSPYLGTEISTSGNIIFLSDFSVSLSANAFIVGVSPIGAFDAELFSTRQVIFSASLSAKLQF